MRLRSPRTSEPGWGYRPLTATLTRSSWGRGQCSRTQMAEHLALSAFVYVRQSSLRQVRHHLESQRRQYAFADQAAALGWSRERVVVVDEDQCKSGAIPQARAGFAKLVGAVARGEVGIVMSLELSRLSRNDAD